MNKHKKRPRKLRKSELKTKPKAIKVMELIDINNIELTAKGRRLLEHLQTNPYQEELTRRQML